MAFHRSHSDPNLRWKEKINSTPFTIQPSIIKLVENFPDREDSYGSEKLLEAARYNLDFLLRNGKGKDLKENARALELAISQKTYSLVELLVVSPLEFSWIESTLKQPLIHTAFAKMPDVLPLCFRYSADINQKDSSGSTILHKLLRNEFDYGLPGSQDHLLKILLLLNANVFDHGEVVIPIKDGKPLKVQVNPMVMAAFTHKNNVYAEILRKHIKNVMNHLERTIYFRKIEKNIENLRKLIKESELTASKIPESKPRRKSFSIFNLSQKEEVKEINLMDSNKEKVNGCN